MTETVAGYRLRLEPGLKRDLLSVLRDAVGRENAVSRGRLIYLLGKWNESPHFERTVRAAIVELRNDGHLICSTGGTDGGYWMAKDWQELLEFTEREYHARAMSMLTTEKVMKAAAQDKWGPVQERMF